MKIAAACVRTFRGPQVSPFSLFSHEALGFFWTRFLLAAMFKGELYGEMV